MSGGTVAGRIWRERILGTRVPLATAASTKGCSLTDSTTARTSRTTRGISGKPRSRLRTRHVVGVSVVDVAHALPGLGLIEYEGTRPDVGRDLLHRVRLGLLLAHDVAQWRRGLAERVDQVAVWFFENELEGLVVLFGDVADALHHVLAGTVTRGPAPQRGDDVVGGDGRAVSEFEPIAQLEGPGLLVVRGSPFRHHLRFGIEIGVDAEQRVVEHGAVVG